MIKNNNLLLFIKSLVFISVVITFSKVSAQVTGVKYFLDQVSQSADSAVFSVNILVTSGKAEKALERLQTNSVFTIVYPANAQLDIINTYMPIVNNLSGGNFEPAVNWSKQGAYHHFNSIPEVDFQSINPVVGPPASFNNLYEGDIVRLCDISIKNSSCFDLVRFFENDIDPSSSHPEAMGRNFKNNFFLGNSMQLYNGNLPKRYSLIANAYYEDANQLKSNAVGSSYKWYNCESGDLVAMTTLPYFLPNESGLYYVEIDNAACPIKSDCFQYSITQVLNEPNAPLIFYPNPVKDFITISNKYDNKLNYKIFDSRATLILAGKLENEIDLRNIGIGVYFLQISNEREIYNTKFVKN